MPVTELEHAHAAAAGAEHKDAYVRDMFSAIAPRYDLLNRVLSLNLDRWWRRRALATLDVSRRPNGCYLDLCAGTLDVTTAVARTAGFTGSVIGADFAEPMLRAGTAKLQSGERRTANGERQTEGERMRPVFPVAGDALALPIASGSIAGAIVAFGLRNVANIDAALREVARVLEPGGQFVILEFTTPTNPLIRLGYLTYFHHVLPRVGRWVSGHRTAYSYLPKSVEQSPLPPDLAARMTRAGFHDVRWELLTFGVVAIHVGTK